MMLFDPSASLTLSVRQTARCAGRRFYLGAPLARLEIAAAIVAPLKRFPRLTLDPQQPTVMAEYEFRKPAELWLTW